MTAPSPSSAAHRAKYLTLPRIIVLVTAVHLGCGILAWFYWRLQGDVGPLSSYFNLAASPFLLVAAGGEALLAGVVWRCYQRQQAMWWCWGLLFVSGILRIVSYIVMQHRAIEALFADQVPSQGPDLSLFLIIDGPGRVAVLLAALAVVLRVYRNSGWLATLKPFDRALLTIVGLHVARQGYLLLSGSPGGPPADSFLTDVLLLGLLFVALLLYRTASASGGGYVARCWGAYAAGAFLLSLGNIGKWLVFSAGVPWEAASLLNWYVWFPAAAAYALAPAYLREAQFRLLHNSLPAQR